MSIFVDLAITHIGSNIKALLYARYYLLIHFQLDIDMHEIRFIGLWFRWIKVHRFTYKLNTWICNFFLCGFYRCQRLLQTLHKLFRNFISECCYLLNLPKMRVLTIQIDLVLPNLISFILFLNIDAMNSYWKQSKGFLVIYHSLLPHVFCFCRFAIIIRLLLFNFLVCFRV